MKPVTIYIKPGCPFCIRAVKHLSEKGADITEIVASNDPEKKQEMMDRSGGGRTFPQIFIGDTHIGGCDDMLAMDRAGKLDPLLAD